MHWESQDYSPDHQRLRLNLITKVVFLDIYSIRKIVLNTHKLAHVKSMGSDKGSLRYKGSYPRGWIGAVLSTNVKGNILVHVVYILNAPKWSEVNASRTKRIGSTVTEIQRVESQGIIRGRTLSQNTNVGYRHI